MFAVFRNRRICSERASPSTRTRTDWRSRSGNRPRSVSQPGVCWIDPAEGAVNIAGSGEPAATANSPDDGEQVEHVVAERRIACDGHLLAGAFTGDALREDAPRDVLRDGDGGGHRPRRFAGPHPLVTTGQGAASAPLPPDLKPDYCAQR